MREGFIIRHHLDTPVSSANPPAHPDPHQDIYAKTTLGFWMYLMSDCILFATFFVTYALLQSSTFGGPTSKDLFSLKLAFTETLVLLASSVTCGLGMLASCKENKISTLGWLILTFGLGISFVFMELTEFKELIEADHGWQTSAFLSSFFSLVGTHGLHVSCGLIWLFVMMAQIAIMGLNTLTFRRLALFSLFWHFLDLIWIFIFTFVYLIGVL